MELDPVVLKLAKEYFGFVEDDCLQVVHCTSCFYLNTLWHLRPRHPIVALNAQLITANFFILFFHLKFVFNNMSVIVIFKKGKFPLKSGWGSKSFGRGDHLFKKICMLLYA